MTTTSVSRGCVDHIKTLYSWELMEISFNKGIYLSSMGDEGDVVLESLEETERFKITVYRGPYREFFYMYLFIIYDLGVGSPFTILEYKVLKTINVVWINVLCKYNC